MLDPKYFELLLKKTEDNFNYSVYQPINSPVILYSQETFKPLVSIHFLSKSGKSIISQVPKSLSYQGFCDFQGITTQDNEEFSLVITNLSSEGMVNFDIVKTNKNKDYLGQVNKINTLDRGRSYVLECDQTTGKSMILSIAKEKENGDSSEGIKMGDIVKKGNDVGTFFSITIAPEVKISDDYKNTQWGCLDLILIREQKQVSRAVNRMPFGGFEIYHPEAEEDFDDFDMMDEAPPVRPLGLKYASRSSQSRNESVNIASLSIQKNSGPSEDVLKNSFATKVKSGREIDVLSREINLDIAEERRTIPIVLGLSINSNLTLQAREKDLLMEAANSLLDDYLKNKLSEYLKGIDKIYDDGKCSLCLEENPNMVLYNCGHKCLHRDCMAENLDKCPLCRKFIIAKIDVSA